jgi:hypothetical protein
MLDRSADREPIDNAEKRKQALASLLEAFDYAEDTDSERSDFAVQILQLRELGLNDSDMRWLVRKGFVEHAREVTIERDHGREFRSTGNLTFSGQTCFVLTDAGVANSRSVTSKRAMFEFPKGMTVGSGESGHSLRPVVHWDAEARKLFVNGEVAKRFKWPATNQELVLSTFQEEGWPARIDDPLPPHRPGSETAAERHHQVPQPQADQRAHPLPRGRHG